MGGKNKGKGGGWSGGGGGGWGGRGGWGGGGGKQQSFQDSGKWKTDHAKGGGRDGGGKSNKHQEHAPHVTPLPADNTHALNDSPATVPVFSGTMPQAPRHTELPVYHHADEIRHVAKEYQVICVQGETGCGKSSVVPVLLEEVLGKQKGQQVAVTQPRRLAAISLAKRVASQRDEKVGQSVGYRVGMDGKCGDDTRISFVTTGWLLMYLAHKPHSIKNFSFIVLDEIHERDLDMDLLCVLLKKSLVTHPTLRIVIMSATLDASSFLSYFQCGTTKVLMQPVVVGARRFPTWPYFLDDIAQSVKGLDGKTVSTIQRVVSGKFARAEKVEVHPQLFTVCVKLVEALGVPGVSFLIFLPGLSEIEQLHAEFLAHEPCDSPYAYHLLHSIIPHETQQLALYPPPAGKIKIVLSTNIAESSVTIPDVRYVIDFGIIRKLVLDDERAMLTLCNTWCSRATCMQRRGRCGRLADGVILYLFPRRMYYDTMPEYASAESLAVPLETIYLRAEVLLSRLGTPEDILRMLMDPPALQRIKSAAQNLRDLNALVGPSVTALGRVAVFMPITIQLTRLVVLAWAMGNVLDGVVMAAALSTQDIFKLATPQSANRLEDFPSLLATNYITRMRHDDGQFSEPIMYRNLFLSFLEAKQGFHQWADANCVSVSRVQQFVSLAVEIAAKFSWAVPDAEQHTGLRMLSEFKQKMKDHSTWATLRAQFDTSVEAYTRLKFVLCGAFAPSFVLGEINFTNKNKPKFMSCGYEPMRTCLLQSIKPEALRNDHELYKLCEVLAPVSQLWVDTKANRAFIECGDDSLALPDRSTPTVHQMPLLAQLLHQLSRMPTKVPTLRVPHEPVKIGSANFLNGMRWRLAGQSRMMAQPYWRSVMGYMCEMRSEIKAHYGVCASLLGREGPDQARVSGLTILPPPGQYLGTIMILTFLSGPVAIDLVPHGKHGLFKGLRATFTDCPDGKPMILTFAPKFISSEDIDAMNQLREALNYLLQDPSSANADAAAQALAVVERSGHCDDAQVNDWYPLPFEEISGETVRLQLVASSSGGLEHLRIPGVDVCVLSSPQQCATNAYGWLRSLSGQARRDLYLDLRYFQQKNSVVHVELLEDNLVITGSLTAHQQAELASLMRYYEAQTGWMAAEMRVTEDIAPEDGTECVGAFSGNGDASAERGSSAGRGNMSDRGSSEGRGSNADRHSNAGRGGTTVRSMSAIRSASIEVSREKRARVNGNVPIPTPWLGRLDSTQRAIVQSDLDTFAVRYSLAKALIVGSDVEIEGASGPAIDELRGMFAFYESQAPPEDVDVEAAPASPAAAEADEPDVPDAVSAADEWTAPQAAENEWAHAPLAPQSPIDPSTMMKRAVPKWSPKKPPTADAHGQPQQSTSSSSTSDFPPRPPAHIQQPMSTPNTWDFPPQPSEQTRQPTSSPSTWDFPPVPPGSDHQLSDQGEWRQEYHASNPEQAQQLDSTSQTWAQEYHASYPEQAQQLAATSQAWAQEYHASNPEQAQQLAATSQAWAQEYHASNPEQAQQLAATSQAWAQEYHASYPEQAQQLAATSQAWTQEYHASYPVQAHQLAASSQAWAQEHHTSNPEQAQQLAATSQTWEQEYHTSYSEQTQQSTTAPKTAKKVVSVPDVPSASQEEPPPKPTRGRKPATWSNAAKCGQLPDGAKVSAEAASPKRETGREDANARSTVSLRPNSSGAKRKMHTRSHR